MLFDDKTTISFEFVIPTILRIEPYASWVNIPDDLKKEIEAFDLAFSNDQTH